jgi:endonuclease/exonuclease/phosphatase (EEP) superfamily protein YafD
MSSLPETAAPRPASPVRSPVSARHRHVPFHLAASGLVGVAAAVTLPDLVLLDQATPFAQLVSFRPYVLTGVAALVLVLAGLSWRCRRLVPATSMLMIVLSVGTALVIPRTQAEPLPAGGRALTVLTFNTLNGSADVDEVAALIGRERPDLVALIEAGNEYRDRLAPLVEPHGYRTFTAAGMDGDGDVEDLHGVTTLVADHLGPVTSDADMSAPFPSMRVEGGELGAVRFVAYHAVAPRLGDVDQWRSDLDKLSRYCAGNTPAIIAGDFNATLDHSALRAAIAGCSDAASQRGQGLVPTWPTWAPDWFGPQIDHIFATDPITAEQFTTREVTGSDHRAVLARLRIPERAALTTETE